MNRAGHQMSETLFLGALLTVTGGFLDAYTYLCRGKVFANAQTGNIVLLGVKLAEGQFDALLHYLIPILAFALGVVVAELTRRRFRSHPAIHWRQIVIALEIAILGLVALLPTGEWDTAANVLVSFVCAVQVQSFRKIRGNALATTMCIGNMRNATDLLCAYQATGDKRLKRKSLQAYTTILIFVLGATLGKFACDGMGLQAIWICCVGLLLAFLIMFIHDELAANPDLLEHERETIREELLDVRAALRRLVTRK